MARNKFVLRLIREQSRPNAPWSAGGVRLLPSPQLHVEHKRHPGYAALAEVNERPQEPIAAGGLWPMNERLSSISPSCFQPSVIEASADFIRN